MRLVDYAGSACTHVTFQEFISWAMLAMLLVGVKMNELECIPVNSSLSAKITVHVIGGLVSEFDD